MNPVMPRASETDPATSKRTLRVGVSSSTASAIASAATAIVPWMTKTTRQPRRSTSGPPTTRPSAGASAPVIDQ